MRRLYLICIFACISFNIKAQNAENPCNYSFSVDVVKKEGPANKTSYLAAMNWDFTTVASTSEITIELIPIRDCWEGINGKQLAPAQNFKVESGAKGSKTFDLITMLAKCFKWRAVITDANCSQTTDWKYYSFLQNN